MTEPEQDILQTFIDDLRTHGILPPPQPWQDALDGKISLAAAAELRRPFESPEEIERNKRLFAPPSELEIEHVLRRRRPWPFLPVLGSISAAAAAAAIVWCIPTEPTAPLLSSYQATCHSCHRASRGTADGQKLSHDLDAGVHWEFTRTGDDTSPVEMIVFASAEERPWHRIKLGQHLSGPSGHLRIRAERLRDLLGWDWTEDSVDLRFFVARPGVIPPTTDAPPDCAATEGAWCRQIHLELFTEGR